MQRILTAILLLFLIAAPSQAVDISTGVFVARVNGAAVRSTDVLLSTTYQPGIMAQHIISHTGSQTIKVDILNFSGAGAYPITNGQTASAEVQSSDGQFTTDLVHRGTVTVTEYDALRHRIKGTIFFSAADVSGRTVTLDEGYFEVR